MELDEIWKIFALEVELGVVNVFLMPKKSITGLLIGSPLAAGGASLVVARREWKKDQTAPPEVRKEIVRHAIRRRWLDDGVHLISDLLDLSAYAERAFITPLCLGLPEREAFKHLGRCRSIRNTLAQ